MISALIALISSLLFADTASAAAPAVDPLVCQALTKHTPEANVAYQPGVDVQGKAVAPADLASSNPLQMPSTINFPLTISLAKALKLDPTQYPYNQLGSGTEASLGMITVEADRVSFNGKPLTDTQQDNLAVLCLKPNK
jgi:hypothetical protein